MQLLMPKIFINSLSCTPAAHSSSRKWGDEKTRELSQPQLATRSSPHQLLPETQRQVDVGEIDGADEQRGDFLVPKAGDAAADARH